MMTVTLAAISYPLAAQIVPSRGRVAIAQSPRLKPPAPPVTVPVRPGWREVPEAGVLITVQLY